MANLLVSVLLPTLSHLEAHESLSTPHAALNSVHTHVFSRSQC